jgi:hypothetical protein
MRLEPTSSLNPYIRVGVHEGVRWVRLLAHRVSAAALGMSERDRLVNSTFSAHLGCFSYARGVQDDSELLRQELMSGRRSLPRTGDVVSPTRRWLRDPVTRSGSAKVPAWQWPLP